MPEGTECAVQAAARLGGVELVWGGVGLGVRFLAGGEVGRSAEKGASHSVTGYAHGIMVSW